MDTVINLISSLFLLTASPWLWLVVGLAAISLVGVGVSAKGLSDAKKGEAKQAEAKRKAQEEADADRAKQLEQLEEKAQEEAKEDTADEVQEETAEEIAEEQGEEPVEEQPEEVAEEVAEEQPEEIAEQPVEETAEEQVVETDASTLPEEVAEQPEEIAEEPVEEVQEPVEEQPEEIAEETAEEPIEEPVEESEEEITEQAADQTPSTDTAIVTAQSVAPVVGAVVAGTAAVGAAVVGAAIAEEKKDDDFNITVDQEQRFVFYNGYRRSFESKLIQSSDLYKDFYSAIKNKLLSYKKIHARLSWSCESFRFGRKLESKLTFRGKTLCLFLALDVNEFPENIYHQHYMGDKKKYAEVPMMVRVRSKLGLKRALTLIEILMEKEGIQLDKKYQEVDYSNIPYEEDAPLIERGLIKIVQNKRAIVQKEGETQEEAVTRIIEEIKENEKDEEDLPLSQEELAEELEYTVDEEQQFIYYTIYRRSFESKLIQSKPEYKNYYSVLKNELLSYKKMRARTSWACESFRNGRELKAKLTYRGKTLCLFLALNPEEYPENIYHQRNMGDKKKYAEVPLMVRVRSDLGLKRALTLIQIMMANSDIPSNPKYQAVDYSNIAFEPDAPLIERGLIKLGKGKRSIVLKDGETEEEAVKRTVEEIKQAEREEDEEDAKEELQYTVDEEQQAVLYTVYRRSFESKLIQSKPEYKRYYSELKNELVSYKNIHARISWSCESFRLGRVLKAKLAYRGKTLCLFLALNPEEYPVNIYHQRNMGDKKKYAEVPLMVRVRSDLGLKRALTLIKVLMTIDDVPLSKKFTPVDYTTIPYEEDAPLIERKLIKLATGRRFFTVNAGETQEEAVKRTVDVIKAQNKEEDEEPSEKKPETLETPETPAFAEVEEVKDVLPEAEVPQETAPEFAGEEEISEDNPDEFATPERVAPDFVQAEGDEETAPVEVIAPETETPAFADVEEVKDVLPEAEVPQEPAPEFAGEEETSDFIPDEFAAPVTETPDFVQAEGNEETAPVEVIVPESETPDFAGEQDSLEEKPDEFSAPVTETPDFVQAEGNEETAPVEVIVPESATPDFAGEQESVEERPDEFSAPQGAFVPSFDGPDTEMQEERQTQFATPEEAFLAFASPNDDIGARPTRLDVVSESGPVIPKDLEEAQLAGVSEDYFATAPTFLEGGEQQAVAPETPAKDLFGRPLPKGLYDVVPEKPKKKEEVKPEEKREIPSGELSPEDAKKVAEDQAALDALIEEEAEETTINEDDEAQYEIVGTAEDTSAFTAFENKLLTGSNKIKYFYSEIKNAIMSYKHVKCKTSNAGDSFRQGNNLIARITFNNNRLRLHLCLNPKAYSVKEYNHYSLKNVAAYQEVPFTLELVSRKDLLNATKLIQDAMASKYVIYIDEKREYVDYAAMYTLKNK